jgi:carboxylesterase type B
MGSTAFYGPVENLVSLYDGQAIVVTSNFRVGNFGFLALNELSKEDPRGVSGNYALLDIQQALRWVQTNAAAFGGDKSKVRVLRLSHTILAGLIVSVALLSCGCALAWHLAHAQVTLIGQSSGGTNILALMASPASKNLFSAGISLSGSPNITMSLAAAEAQDQKFVENVRCYEAPTPNRAVPLERDG